MATESNVTPILVSVSVPIAELETGIGIGGNGCRYLARRSGLSKTSEAKLENVRDHAIVSTRVSIISCFAPYFTYGCQQVLSNCKQSKI